MTKPVTIPNTFATATTAIPLSNLDADFSTVATAMNDANTYSNYAPDTGSANAYVVTLTGVSTLYSAGLRIQFKAGNANTTASTLNVNGQGAKNITYQDASAIASGTIAANAIVDVMYDGTQFLLMNDPAGATGGDVVGPSSATDNAIVRFDGTTGKLVQNSVVTIADSTGDISGVGTLNATTLDATNIEVTNIKAKDGTAAASIADSTGVISVTANPVLSGGTANGVLYLNGSKVATSGSALTFDGADFSNGAGKVISGGDLRATITGTGNVGLNLVRSGGTAADWYNYIPSGSADLVWYKGSELMRLTSTGLGIGTSSPAYKLDVVGEVRANNLFRTTDGTNIGLFGSGVFAGGVVGIGSSNSVPLVFGTGATERMRLDSSGNLGLGVTPSAWGFNGNLELSATNNIAWTGSGNMLFNAYYSVSAGAHLYKTSAGAARYQGTNGGQHQWFNAPSGTAGNAITFTQAMTLDASGNLLLNTTTANGYKFNCVGSAYFGNGYISCGDNAYIRTDSTGWMQLQGGSNGTRFMNSSNATEYARITSGGFFKQSTNGSYFNGNYNTIQNNNNTSGDTILVIGNSAGNATNNTSSYFLVCGDNSANRLYIYGNGNVENVNNSYGAISDIKFKENIVDATPKLADLMQVKVRNYNLKSEPDHKQLGVIAQELEQVFPAMVDETPDRDAEGNDLGTTTKSVKYSVFVPMLIKAMQEQQALITSLTARVALLEGN